MHALVTGASSGIGADAARALSTICDTVTLVARREEKLREVAETCEADEHVVHPYDLSELDGLDAFVSEVRQKGGPVDILVNNAGISRVGPWSESEWGTSRTLLEVNLLAPIRLMELIVPKMCERGDGAVVNVSSVAALAWPPYMVQYNASKAGLASASESLRPEVKPQGVDVVTVYPGPVRTPLGGTIESGFDSGVTGMLPWGETDVLAQRILRAVERGSSRIVYPRWYYICRWFPLVTRLITGMSASRVTPESALHD